MLAPHTEHRGQRPDWDCRVCGQPWPCATAKVELSEQYQKFPHGLAVSLGSFLREAIDDCSAGHGGPPAGLYDRFLGWAEEPGQSNKRRIEMLRNDLITDLGRHDNDPVEVRVGTETVAVEGSEVIGDKIVLRLNRAEEGIALEHAVLDVLDEREARTDEGGGDDGSRGRSMVLAAHEQRAGKPEVGC